MTAGTHRVTSRDVYDVVADLLAAAEKKRAVMRRHAAAPRKTLLSSRTQPKGSGYWGGTFFTRR